MYHYFLDVQINDEIQQGEEYVITTIVYYADNNSETSLGFKELFSIAQDGNSVTVEGVEVHFEVRLMYDDGSEIKITKSAITNSVGLAFIILSPTETQPFKFNIKSNITKPILVSKFFS